MMCQPIDVQHHSCLHRDDRCVARTGNSLVEAAPIQSHNNVAVLQTSVICFKVADILKLALGHVAGTGKKTGQGFANTKPDTSTKSADLSN